MSVHYANRDMRINGVVVVEKDGPAQKNARHYIGKEAATNKNVENCFSLLQSKLGMTGWWMQRVVVERNLTNKKTGVEH